MASDAGNYNIAFNADTNTLTLNNANIAGQYDFTYNNVGAGIWAYSRSGAVSLNIQVTGNNVVSGSIGIYALSNGGEVSVTISGGGSLTASGSSNGLRAVSTISSAALAIEGTAVKASGSYSEGVLVQAGESSTGSLSVDGGSLTASGRKGILFPIGSPSLNVNDSTIVRARGGIAAGINEDDPVPTNGVGIVFNGSTGTVYGNASLQEDLIIGEGESLTLDKGASLNANGHNVIVDGGTLDEGIKNSLGDSVKYTPTITTASLPNGTAEAAYSTTLLAEGTAPITWSVTSGFLPEGLSLDAGTGVISGTPTAEGGSTFTVEAANDYGSDSREFTLSIDKPVVIPVTGVKLDKTSLTLQETDSDTLTATVEPADAANKGLTWQWQISRDDGTTWVDIDGATGSSYMIQAVTMDMDGNQYRCTVKGADGNSVTSNAATLTVAPGNTP
ncbi:MAG TPA: putative Ig domain-containing protein [Candidatus Eisenbergiella stercoravium]|nr:putative Ig domain-containing protein [Candidatus Eisenbergiella stercoravium]